MGMARTATALDAWQDGVPWLTGLRVLPVPDHMHSSPRRGYDAPLQHSLTAPLTGLHTLCASALSWVDALPGGGVLTKLVLECAGQDWAAAQFLCLCAKLLGMSAVQSAAQSGCRHSCHCCCLCCRTAADCAACTWWVVTCGPGRSDAQTALHT